jgi:hypothetical protein
VANTLAYYAAAKNTVVKRLKQQDPEAAMAKKFL